MKILKAILGTAVGLVLFFLIRELTEWVVLQACRIPVIGYILDYPKICPWALTLIPPIVAVQSGAAASGKIARTAMPYGIILALAYGARAISMFAAHNLMWQMLISTVVIVVSAVVVTGYHYAIVPGKKQ